MHVNTYMVKVNIHIHMYIYINMYRNIHEKDKSICFCVYAAYVD